MLRAAKEKFERFGFKKTTVDEIASGAGISKRTLYEMFDSKERLLSDLVMSEALTIRRSILNELKHTDDPLAKLYTFTRRASEYFEQNPFLGKVLSDEAGLFVPFLKKEIRLIEEGIEEIYAAILREGTDRGVFRQMDEEATASCIFALFRSFTYAKTLKPNGAWVQFILNAILADHKAS